MNTIRCPNCQVQLVLPDDSIASCQCIHCKEVFEPASRRVDIPADDVPPEFDISTAHHEAEILAERERFRRSLDFEHSQLEEREERWRKSVRTMGLAFVIGFVTGPLLKSSVRLSVDFDLEMAVGTAVLAALGGFTIVFLAHTWPLRGERWGLAFLAGVLLVWMTLIVALNSRSARDVNMSAIAAAGMSGLFVVFFSWFMLRGFFIIFDKSRR